MWSKFGYNARIYLNQPSSITSTINHLSHLAGTSKVIIYKIAIVWWFAWIIANHVGDRNILFWHVPNNIKIMNKFNYEVHVRRERRILCKSSVSRINATFCPFQRDRIYRLNFSPQKFSIEKIVNNNGWVKRSSVQRSKDSNNKHVSLSRSHVSRRHSSH